MTGFSQPERRALARSQSAPAHPDADLLNAFSEQAVTSREREQVLAHLAVCPTCREVIALAAPPVEETLPERVPEPSPWKWPLVRWGAVAASAIIVVIAVSIGINQKPAPTMQVATETTPLAAPATRAQKTIQEQVKTEEVSASAGMKAPQVRYEKVAPKPKQEVASRTDAVSSSAVPLSPMLNKVAPPMEATATGGAVGGPLRTRKESAAEAKKDKTLVANDVSATSANEAKLSAPPPPSSPVPASSVPPGVASETVTVQSNAPAVATAQAEAVHNNRQVNDLQKSAPAAAREMRMNAYTLDQRWQVTPDGYLLSSTDEGKNWVRQLPDLRFTHVQTVGFHVWACGPDGVLMHSMDRGLNWNKVTPTDGKATLLGEIVSIVFSDVDHGTLETSKPESWTTSDAGKTWKKQ